MRQIRIVRGGVGAGLLLAFLLTGPLGAQSGEARTSLTRYLDGIARLQLAERQQAVARIHSRADSEVRRKVVREKILRLLGGLPERTGPPAVKSFGTYEGDGFRVENVAYESLPGFWVTANLYLPTTGVGPFPAVIVAPGHGTGGKLEDWSWGANFARNGIAALAYDPLGQGERLQYFDPERNASIVGSSTGEHGEANVPALLIGDNVARYMVNDAMRGVDYLAGRPDIYRSHIGAFGCSGGGTTTAYLAALDERIQVAASACYITSFQELLASATGVQEAEQSLPHFIEQGLDFADWVELFAPKPYAIVSTRDDMFPFEGARQTYEEARRIYSLYGAGDRIQWITGPGGHGNLGPVSLDIMRFFTRFLKGSSAEPTFTPMRLERREILQVTPTGQVSTSLHSETVYSLNRARAEALVAARKVGRKLGQLRIRQDIAALTATTVKPGAPPPKVDFRTTARPGGYRIGTFSMRSDGEIEVPGLVAVPEGSRPKPVVLMMGRPLDDVRDDVDRLAQAGYLVMALALRPDPPGAESAKSAYLGNFNLLSLHAFLVGKTLIGLRIDDAIRAMDWLHARRDVNRSSIVGYGNGPGGLVLLHAAALDPRITRVVVENALVSYRMIVDQPLHRNVSESVIPGVLRKYDTSDLLLALSGRPVLVINPEDALGEPVTNEEFRKALPQVFAPGSAARVRVSLRKPGEPLPIQ